MKISLYDATVRTYLQFLPAIIGCMDKGKACYASEGMDLQEFVGSNLHKDMLPLHFQIVTLVHFSRGAIDAARNGEIGGPDMTLAFDFDGLQSYLSTTLDELRRLKPQDINNLAGGEVVFKYGDVTLPFKTEDFFLSYAVPNFFFHATTTYGIFRSLGVNVGIANFLGQVHAYKSPNIPPETLQQSGAKYLEILEKLSN